MYSFALVMWECINYKLPYEDIPSRDLKTKIGKEGYRLKVLLNPNLAATDYIKNVIERCWCQDSKKRPTFKDLEKETSLKL